MVEARLAVVRSAVAAVAVASDLYSFKTNYSPIKNINHYVYLFDYSIVCGIVSAES